MVGWLQVAGIDLPARESTETGVGYKRARAPWPDLRGGRDDAAREQGLLHTTRPPAVAVCVCARARRGPLVLGGPPLSPPRPGRSRAGCSGLAVGHVLQVSDCVSIGGAQGIDYTRIEKQPTNILRRLLERNSAQWRSAMFLLPASATPRVAKVRISACTVVLPAEVLHAELRAPSLERTNISPSWD